MKQLENYHRVSGFHATEASYKVSLLVSTRESTKQRKEKEQKSITTRKRARAHKHIRNENKVTGSK